MREWKNGGKHSHNNHIITTNTIQQFFITRLSCGYYISPRVGIKWRVILVYLFIHNRHWPRLTTMTVATTIQKPTLRRVIARRHMINKWLWIRETWNMTSRIPVFAAWCLYKYIFETRIMEFTQSWRIKIVSEEKCPIYLNIKINSGELIKLLLYRK